MGGKNSAPAAPDYGPLAAASEKSAKYAYDTAMRQQDWAEKTYADNKAISDIVIDKAIGALDVQEADAARARERQQRIFEPLEEQLAADAESYASAERQEVEAGKAEADVAAQFEQARDAATANLEQYGIDPSQARGQAIDRGARLAEAAAQASAGNQARTNTENIGRALRSEAINVGRGYPGQIAGSMAGAGASGNQAVNTGLATTASGAQTMGTGQGWQGLGNQAIAGWGNVLNAGYNNQMAQHQANQQASSGWGNLLGTLAGTALTFVQKGGVIPEDPGYEEQVIPTEDSQSAGAVPDDVPAQLTPGEFVVPQDVVAWLGEKGMQQIVLKARKEMTGANGERPAQPDVAQIPADSVGAIPMPQGVA